jgi:serine/threonine protein phosphatase 1
MKGITRLTAKSRAALNRVFGDADFPHPAPGRLTYVVGDIHGRADLLDRLLELIEQDRPASEPIHLVFAGDYIDRGGSSAEVLGKLAQLQESRPDEVVCIRGNHEDMMLRTLAGDEAMSSVWFGNGGLETLASFGIDLSSLPTGAAALAETLSGALPRSLVSFLEKLLPFWVSGNVAVVHAALDPLLPVGDGQSLHACLWGHPDFGKLPRQDGIWVVHGHKVVVPARIQNGVVSMDTGAWFTGVLTAAVIPPGGPIRFIDTA